MTELNTRVPPGTGAARRPAMRFSVDGWDPSYGASLELEGQLEESTARIDADVEVPAGRWRPVDPDPSGPLPDALLFVDGVRRVEAQLWIDGDAAGGDAAVSHAQVVGARDVFRIELQESQGHLLGAQSGCQRRLWIQ